MRKTHSKISPKLTVNYGVRWDFEPPRSERYGRQYYWDQNYNWSTAGAGAIVPNAGWSWSQVLQQAGLNAASTPTPLWMTNGILGRLCLINTTGCNQGASQSTHADHFSPHTGIAYQFLPHTVLRASYGINWLTTTGNELLDSADRNVGFGSVAHISSGTGNNGLTYISKFSNPMPGGFGYVSPTTNMTALNYEIEGQWLDAPAYNIEPGFEHTVSLGSGSSARTKPRGWLK